LWIAQEIYRRQNEEGPGIQKWHKGPRPKTAATRQNRNKGPKRQTAAVREKVEGKRDRHRRVELKTGITSWKKSSGLQVPQEDPRAGVREETRNAQQVTGNKEMDLVER
jgi:hypothetical protein